MKSTIYFVLAVIAVSATVGGVIWYTKVDNPAPSNVDPFNPANIPIEQPPPQTTGKTTVFIPDRPATATVSSSDPFAPSQP